MEAATALIFCWYNAKWQQTEKKKKKQQGKEEMEEYRKGNRRKGLGRKMIEN